jgi:hypothetical protein
MKIMADLRQERLQIEEAIVSLERLARSNGPRRGRPPAWLAEQPKRLGRPPGSKNKAAPTPHRNSFQKGQALQNGSSDKAEILRAV